MPAREIQAKWDGIYSRLPETEPEPSPLLVEFAHLLPVSGYALDLACGLGGSALFLARRGLQATAWDVSPVAIARLTSLANRSRLPVLAEIRNVEEEPFPREAFDVVVVSRFLARALALPITASLKAGGLLYYQTYTRQKLSPTGPNNPDYLLGENELLELFRDLKLVAYLEEGRIGDLAAGRRDEAYFIGRKA